MISREEYECLSLEDKLELIGVSGKEIYFDEVLMKFNYDKRYFYIGQPIENIEIKPREIIGTQHARYYETKLIDAFNSLKRGYNNVKYYLDNPNHYNDAHRPSPHIISIYKVEGKGLFINQGNNRLIIAMILGLSKVRVDYCEVYKIDNRLKLAIETLEENGFEVIFNEESRTNFSVLPLKVKYKDSFLDVKRDSHILEYIFDIYKGLKYSKYKIIKHKILSNIRTNYLNKYKKTDKVKDWFHRYYLEFQK